VPSKSQFVVIDWGGANINGVPYFDLVNFSISVGTSKAKLRREVVPHSDLLHCAPRHSLGYLLSGFGKLHSELEYFPASAFLDLCTPNFHALNAVQ
jgi:hypothetical protein